MGSCSLRSRKTAAGSVKVVSSNKDDQKEFLKSKNPVNKDKKISEEKKISIKDQRLEAIEAKGYKIVIGDDQFPRKSKKKLTVISTNEYNIDPSDINREMSLVSKPSLGKAEQGSLIVLKNPVIFGGTLSSKQQKNFEEKLMTIEGDDVKRDYLLEHKIWVSCKKGLKPESPNQDDYIVLIDNNSLVLGVFDGHGSHGHDISNHIHKTFPKILINHNRWADSPSHAIADAFPAVHQELLNFCANNSKYDATLSGSTATLVYIKEKKLYVGHVGDSRAVLAKKNKGRLVAVNLTRDHKPSLEDETLRINRMGGEVRKIDDDIPHRVFCRGKNYPGIATSRTIGDALAQRVGVVCMPEVNEIDITDDDLFVLICSDGVWEFISSEEAVNEIYKHEKNIKSAVEALATLAWDRWIKAEEDIVDDITVILVYLRNP